MLKIPAEDGATNQIKDLATGFSTQSSSSNRLWYVVFSVSVLVLFPDLSLDDHGLKLLPFGFGKIESHKFNVFIFFIFSVISIAFCSARAQTLIAYRFSHDEIDNIADEVYREKQRKYFDVLTKSSILRVGPLSSITQMLISDAKENIYCIKIYYSVMKYMAMIMYYTVPIFAIIVGLFKLVDDSHVHVSVKIFAIFIFVLTIFSFLQIVLVDISQTKNVHRKISAQNGISN